MARAFKQGLDYFPLDVDLDDKFALIKAKFGMEGFGTIISLFQKIYKVGYYYRWTEKEQLLFSTSVNVDINTINAIIKAAAAWELFSETLLNDYNILTSHGIQKRYFGAISRREKITIYKELLLIDVSDCKNSIIVNINPQNADICTQSTVQYSTIKNILHFETENAELFKNNTNPEQPKTEKSKPLPEKLSEEFYLTAKGQKLKGFCLEKFKEFWKVFNYHRDKPAAADEWLKIKNLDEIFEQIIYGAKKTAEERSGLEAKGISIKMAQGWLHLRRWENYPIPESKKKISEKSLSLGCAKCGSVDGMLDLQTGLCRKCYIEKND